MLIVMTIALCVNLQWFIFHYKQNGTTIYARTCKWLLLPERYRLVEGVHMPKKVHGAEVIVVETNDSTKSVKRTNFQDLLTNGFNIRERTQFLNTF